MKQEKLKKLKNKKRLIAIALVPMMFVVGLASIWQSTNTAESNGAVSYADETQLTDNTDNTGNTDNTTTYAWDNLTDDDFVTWFCNEENENTIKTIYSDATTDEYKSLYTKVCAVSGANAQNATTLDARLDKIFPITDNTKYIYFDLNAGDVTIKDNTYTGYVYTYGTTNPITISGTHSSENRYYVYQSSSQNTATTGRSGVNGNYTYTLPSYDELTYNNKTWGEYITNNYDVPAVINTWNSAVASTTREKVYNEICIENEASDAVSVNMVLDNIYAEHKTGYVSGKGTVCNAGYSDTKCGPISVRNIDTSVTLRLKGDNRVRNIYYLNNQENNGKLVVTSAKRDNSIDGTLTITDYTEDHPSYMNVIGAREENEYGLTFSGGRIFAGFAGRDNQVWGDAGTEVNFPVCVGGGMAKDGQITVTGGAVTAVSNATTAALGGGGGYGSKGGRGFIEITGGSVYAYATGIYSTDTSRLGYVPSTAIGGGATFKDDAQDGTEITISGGYVYAKSLGGTAIGGASSRNGTGGSATINISGGTVTAESAEGTAYNNTVTVSSGTAIGGGVGHTGGSATVRICGNAVVTANTIGGGNAIVGKGWSNSVYTDVASGNGGDATIILGKKFEEDSKEIYQYDEDCKAQVTLTSGIGGGKSASADGGTATVILEGGNLNAGTSIGGGTGGTDGSGGSATIEVYGGYIHTGIIGGGDIIKGSNGNIGFATATISGGEVQGQFVLRGGNGAGNQCSFTMTGGTIENVKATSEIYSNRQKNGGAIWMDDDDGIVNISGGTISGCSAQNGGAVYMTAGTFTMTGGTITGCTATENGGAVYVGSENTTSGSAVIKGGTITGCSAQNGGALYVRGVVNSTSSFDNDTSTDNASINPADYTVYVRSGEITNNKASQNGGAICVNNGHVLVDGGNISYNQANGEEETSGFGGAIYLSSRSVGEAIVRVRSGVMEGNSAKNSGAAIAITGNSTNTDTTNAVVLKVTVGVNEEHSTDENGAHKYNHTNEYVTHGTITDPILTDCPVLQNNTSGVSGGAIYISGGDTAILNIYCLTETNNTTNGDEQRSNFLMVEGGQIIITTGTKSANSGGLNGCSQITGTIHIVGGKLNIYGTMENPRIDAYMTVDIKNSDDEFNDHRENVENTQSKIYWIHYYENFVVDGVRTGRYVAYPVTEEDNYQQTIMGVLYTHEGYTIVGWNTSADGSGTQFDVGKTYTFPTDVSAYLLDGEGKSDPTNGSFLKLYAIWEGLGYTVNFVANVPAGQSYSGTMDDQSFSINIEAALQANAYRCKGHIFMGWALSADGSVEYVDGAKVTNLTTELGAVVKLYAVWNDCPHESFTDKTTDTDYTIVYTYVASGNTITATCQCDDYVETLTLEAPENNVYTGEAITATVRYSVTSPLSDLLKNTTPEISYKQNNKDLGGSPVDAGQITTATNADGTITATYTPYTYQASITLSQRIVVGTSFESISYTATLTYQIERAEREAPDAPTYKKGDSSVTVQPADTKNYKVSDYEYRLSYLVLSEDGTTAERQTEWKAENVIELPGTYTTYTVYIRFAETGNYYASDETKAAETFYYGKGNVYITVKCSEGMLYNISANEVDNGVGGVVITLYADNGYYLLNDRTYSAVTEAAESNENGTQISSASIAQAGYTYTLSNIPNNSIITVTISGSRKYAAVTVLARAGEVFGTISETANSTSGNGSSSGNSSTSGTTTEANLAQCTIAYNSSFTALFTVQRYYNYTNLQLSFNKPLPQNTTMILMDKSDSTLTYWYYIVGEGGTSEVSLTDFTQMGSTQKFVVGSGTLRYQLVLNFASAAPYTAANGDSNANENGDITLTVTLSATGVARSESETNDGLDIGLGQTAPTLTAAQAQITFKALTFGLTTVNNSLTDSDTTPAVNDELTQTLQMTFAESEGDTSAWDTRAAILVLKAQNDVPSDTHFKVVQGEYTTIYYANDYGEYVIPLEKDVENVNITLQSDMLAAQTTYTFDAVLYASVTEAGTAYKNALNVGSAYGVAESDLLSTLSFTSPVATVLPSLKVTAENRLCEVGGSLNVVITAEDMEGYQIVGTVYLKSDDTPNGTYNSTAQKFIINADGTATEVSEETAEGVEGQPSAADLDSEDGVEQVTSPYTWEKEYTIGLSGQKSGHSFCVIFAVIDTETGLTLYELPLYFIIYTVTSA